MSFKQICSKLWNDTTTATKITAIRLLLVPFIVFFYVGAVAFWTNGFFADYGRLVALIFFLIAIATDYLDGQIAKRFNQKSKKGEWLDTLADKLLVVTGLLLVFTDPLLMRSPDDAIGIVPMFAAVLCGLAIIGSDISASAVKQYGQTKGMELNTGILEKAKVALQFTAVGLFMLFAVNYNLNNSLFPVGPGEDILTYFSWSAMVAAAVLSVINVIYLEVLYFKVGSSVADGTEQTEEGGQAEEDNSNNI
ncbi:MAG: CDP-alcohol phosphatidyltransferase family protein [Firmicutes bacterium]|nr:CDP-alcohol phosphatidyltransferase family protein [Bacillota bacterium]